MYVLDNPTTCDFSGDCVTTGGCARSRHNMASSSALTKLSPTEEVQIIEKFHSLAVVARPLSDLICVSIL